MNKRTKFSLLWGLDVSKGVLFLIAVVAAIKIMFNPGSDPMEIILWRLLEISILVVPLVIIGCAIYGYINYESILEKDKEAQDKKENR